MKLLVMVVVSVLLGSDGLFITTSPAPSRRGFLKFGVRGLVSAAAPVVFFGPGIDPAVAAKVSIKDYFSPPESHSTAPPYLVLSVANFLLQRRIRSRYAHRLASMSVQSRRNLMNKRVEQNVVTSAKLSVAKNIREVNEVPYPRDKCPYP